MAYATPSSHWPASQTDAAATSRPRSATVVITRKDGGVIAGEVTTNTAKKSAYHVIKKCRPHVGIFLWFK